MGLDFRGDSVFGSWSCQKVVFLEVYISQVTRKTSRSA